MRTWSPTVGQKRPARQAATPCCGHRKRRPDLCVSNDHDEKPSFRALQGVESGLLVMIVWKGGALTSCFSGVTAPTGREHAHRGHDPVARLSTEPIPADG